MKVGSRVAVGEALSIARLGGFGVTICREGGKVRFGKRHIETN